MESGGLKDGPVKYAAGELRGIGEKLQVEKSRAQRKAHPFHRPGRKWDPEPQTFGKAWGTPPMRTLKELRELNGLGIKDGLVPASGTRA